jgi:replicative DNA helicase Mcm
MQQDKSDGRWRVIGGAAPRANGSNLYVDELGLMDKDDIKSLIEFMETQIITVDKAGIHATLKAEEGVTIAINPKGGRFDMKAPLADQIDPKIPPQVLSRCDLIYLLPDVPTETKDRKEADDILGLWQGKLVLTDSQIPVELLQKYIAFAKRRKVPVMTDAAKRMIVDRFVEVRKGSGEGTIAVTKRALETFVRLATAHSIMRLGSEVSVQDAEIAIKVLDYSLKQTSVDAGTGKLDSDHVTGQTKERRNLAEDIKSAIKNQGGSTMMEVIVREVKAKNPTIEENRIRGVIEQLHREVILMEVSHGKYMVI